MRQFAALWRHALAKGEAARIRRRCLGGEIELPPFHTMSDAQVTKYFDRMVAAADAAHAFVTQRFLVSNVAATDYDVQGPRVWVGGLSPGGRLVGAMTDLNSFW